jgi:LPXTG-site transpeptidase (sortase) family protein
MNRIIIGRNKRFVFIVKAVIIILLFIVLIFVLLNWRMIKVRYLSQPKPIAVENTNQVTIPEEKIFSNELKRLVIPKLGIEAPIIVPPEDYGDEANEWIEKNVDNGPVVQPGQYFNIKEGNLALYGHSSTLKWNSKYPTIFATLDKLAIGDEIIVYYGDNKQVRYMVTKKPEVIPTNKGEVVQPDQGQGMITLITCWPPGTLLKRMIVRGMIVLSNE